MNASTKYPQDVSQDLTNHRTRIPLTAQARLLLHRSDADPAFREVLEDVLPDEDARLAYLNHLAWQARS